MKTRRKLLIGVIIIVIAIGFLAYRGLASSMSYYYKVDELLSQKTTLVDENVRLFGTIAPGTIEQNGLKLAFAVTDGQQNVPVVYEGAVPDTFKSGREITIEGRLNQDGVFVATVLMPKCPSKYIPET